MSKRTFIDFEEIINNLGYKLLDTYLIDKHYRRFVIEDEIGYIYDTTLKSIQNKEFCIVGKTNPHALKNISLWLKLNNNSIELCDDNEYLGATKNLKFYHSICNEYFYMQWSSILTGQNCAVCAGQQAGKYNNLKHLRPDLIKEYLYSENNKTPKELTLGSHENVYWKCLKCGNEWWAKVNDRVGAGNGCSKCANENKDSNVAVECKIYFFNNYNAIPEYKLFKNPKTNHWLVCDIYIPENIFIEIHGPQHYKINGWHKLLAKKNNRTVEEEFEYRKYLDLIKKEFCQNNGLYIEIDLRKIKTSDEAIIYIENILSGINQ